MKIIRFFDTCNFIVPFKVKAKNTFKSSFSGVMMILFHLCAAGYFFYSIAQFLSKKHFSIEVYNLTQSYEVELKLKESPFTFVFSIFNDSNEVATELLKYLEFEIVQTKFSLAQKPTNAAVPIVKCRPTDFEFLEKHVFSAIQSQYDVSNFNCLDKERTEIGGQVFSSLYKYQTISVRVKPEMRSKHALTQLKAILDEERYFIALIHTNVFVDLEDRNSSIKYTVTRKTIELAYNSVSTAKVYFGNMEFEDTANILTGTDSIESSVYFVNMNYDLRPREGDFLLGEIRLYSDEDVKRIVRKFKTLNQLIPEVTAFLFNFYTLLSFLLRKANGVILVRDTVNECFTLKEHISALKEGKTKEEVNFSVGLTKDWIWPTVTRNKDRSALFKRGETLIQDYLELSNFIKRMQILDGLINHLGISSREARLKGIDLLDDTEYKNSTVKPKQSSSSIELHQSEISVPSNRRMV